MTKIEIILFRNHMTLEEQHRWWREEHAPIVRKVPGLRGYFINFAGYGESGEEPEVCGTNTLTFDSTESAMAAYNSAEWGVAREHTKASGAKALRIWVTEQATIICSTTDRRAK